MRLISPILILFSLAIDCYGFQIQNNSDYYIRNYTDENGLPINGVREIVADSIGFIWLATEGGLVRFDGRNFKIYTKTSLGVQSDRFVHFTRNALNNNIYSVAQFGGIAQINKGEAKKTALPNIKDLHLLDINSVGKKISDVISDKAIRDLKADKYFVLFGEQHCFYFYYNQQIIHAHAGSIKSTPFKGAMFFDIPPMPLQLNNPVSIKEKSLNFLNFFVVDGRLFYHNNSSGNTFTEIAPPTGSNLNVISLQGDIERNPVFATERNNIRIIKNSVNSQSFAYLGSRFYRIRYNQGKLTTQELVRGLDLNSNNINSAYYNESDGCLFLGSISKGLFVLTPKSFKTLSTSDKQGDNIFYAHTSFGASSVLTPQGYVFSLTTTPKKLIPESAAPGFPNKFAILKDRNKSIWVCRKDFVQKLSPDAKQVTGSWLVNDPVKLYEGKNRGIWIGTRSGVLFYLTQTGKEATIESVISIPNTEITWLHQNTPGNIWIGTVKGLFHLNLKSKKISTIKGLEGTNIRCLYSSDANQVWITTYGNGLFLLKKNTLKHLPLDTDEYLNYSHCIIEDSAGYFWITTNKGLFQTRKKDLVDFADGSLSNILYLHYSKNNGFQTNEFNGGCQPCGEKLDDGKISFPSLSGLVLFDPYGVRHGSLGKSFIFQSIDIDGSKMALQDSLELPFDFKHFSFSAATPYFGDKNNLQFRYNIQKIGAKTNDKWLTPDQNQTISVYNLTPGQYWLTVTKITGFNNQFIEKKIFLHVVTPWFFQRWFISLVVISVLGLILLTIRWRTYYLTRQNRQLGKHVAQRTLELTEALKDLRVTEHTLQRQLRIQTTIIGVISHDLRSPLRYLSVKSKDLYQQTEAEFPNFPYLYLGKSIYESIDKVFMLSDDLLRFIKVTRQKQGEITTENVDIVSILEAKRMLFTELAAENQTSILLQIQEKFVVSTNRQLLEIMIHNLLDNAVKSTFMDTIVLSAQKTRQAITLTISDTGEGMPSEIADWLNDSDKTDTSDEIQFPQNMGLGLLVVKEIAAMLQIQVSAKTDSSGTAISLLIS